MDEALIKNWNKVVKPGDIVYHLGDVAMGRYDNLSAIMARLNGSKRLVVGNHDDIPWLSRGGWFKKVMMWRMFPEYNMLLTHVPIHMAPPTFERGYTNVHGHIHQNPPPDGPYKCACVEHTNYTPIHIEEILK